MSFLDLTSLGLQTAASDLANLALGFLQAQIPGYVPSPGDMEVIQAEALSLIAQDVTDQALIVPSAIFRAFGTKLVRVPYLNGNSAQTQVTFTLTDTFGHTIPTRTPLALGGLGFFTQSELVIPNGSNTGTVTVVAVALGTAYNGASTPAELVSGINFVQGVAVLAPAYGGVDQEDDPSYENRLTGELSLQAPRPITADNYAKMALSFPPAPGTDQQEIGRAAAIDGYNPATTTFTGTVTATSATVTAVSSFAGITAPIDGNPGSIIVGHGIPPATTVLAVNPSSSTVTLSNPATIAGTAVTLKAVGSYNNPRMVGVWATLADGTAPNQDTLTALGAWFGGYREVNFITNPLAATYTPVYVASSIHLYPGWNQAGVRSGVQEALIGVLSPIRWGQSPFGSHPDWLNQPYVRYDNIVAAISNARGVSYVPVGSVKLAYAPVGAVNLVPNPSFEYDALHAFPAGWSHSSVNSPPAISTFDVENGWAQAGVQALRMTTAAHTATNQADRAQVNVAVAAGQPYSFQVAVDVLQIPAGGSVAMQVDWYNGGTYLSSFAGPFVTVTGPAVLTAQNVVAPVGATNANLLIYASGANGITDLYLDAVECVQGTLVSAFFDGDTVGCSWAGTPGNSTSSCQGVSTDLALPGPAPLPTSSTATIALPTVV